MEQGIVIRGHPALKLVIGLILHEGNLLITPVSRSISPRTFETIRCHNHVIDIFFFGFWDFVYVFIKDRRVQPGIVMGFGDPAIDVIDLDAGFRESLRTGVVWSFRVQFIETRRGVILQKQIFVHDAVVPIRV